MDLDRLLAMLGEFDATGAWPMQVNDRVFLAAGLLGTGLVTLHKRYQLFADAIRISHPALLTAALYS
jgi:hypothetical protein